MSTPRNSSTKTQTIRTLGVLERYFWLLDQQRPTHFTMVAEITGTASVAEWRQGLAAIQQIHPLLAVSIQLNENNAPAFVTHSGTLIPLKVVKNTNETAWVTALEHEIVQRFNSTAAPLIRAVIYEYQNQSVIALIAHHAISDGRSMTFVFRDLLNAMNGKYGIPHNMPPSMDAYTDLPENAVGQIPASEADILLFKQQPPTAGPNPQIRLMELSSELTQQVIKRSKQEGTTVHGTLCAALVLASKAWKPNPMRIQSAISLRETLGMDETSCASILGRIVPFDIDTIGSFWDIARYAKETLAGANSMQDVTAFANRFCLMLQNGLNVPGVGELVDTARASEYLISNIGVLTFGSDFGKFKLNSMWGPFAVTGYEGNQGLGVVTVNGSIRMMLTSLAHTHVKPVLELMEQILSMECALVNYVPQQSN